MRGQAARRVDPTGETNAPASPEITGISRYDSDGSRASTAIATPQATPVPITTPRAPRRSASRDQTGPPTVIPTEYAPATTPAQPKLPAASLARKDIGTSAAMTGSRATTAEVSRAKTPGVRQSAR